MSDAVLERLESIEQSLKQTDHDRPLNFNEAAHYLNSSKSYLYKLTHRRLIPCFKPLGKKLFFKRQDLEKFLLQRPVKTRAQIEQEAATRAAIGGKAI
jgi:DNA binding domain, excisionase family